MFAILIRGDFMAKNKIENHGKIIEAAYNEFLEYGFVDASMRRIATASGMSASGLYKHFPSKEDMFAALIQPALDGMMDLYHTIENDYDEELKNTKQEDLWTNQNETTKSMKFIYDHFNEFKLLICKSQGTRYENFSHELAILEEEVTVKYMNKLKKNGINVKRVNKKEFHLLVTASVDALFQPVIHDFTRKEAMHYAKTLEEFYMPAWKALFGI